MPSDTSPTLLDEIAAECGIGPGFWDIWGRYHKTEPEVKREILRAMGVDSSDDDALLRSRAERARREWTRLLPASFVVSLSDHLDLPLNVPASTLGESAHIAIQREDCEVFRSEEHTSELQSRRDLVCRLLLEKKKRN